MGRLDLVHQLNQPNSFAGFPMIPPQVNGATTPLVLFALDAAKMFPMIPPQVNGATYTATKAKQSPSSFQ